MTKERRRERAELARLLCEMGRAPDPRADGLRRVDVAEIYNDTSAPSAIPWETRALTTAEVDTILAEYFAARATPGDGQG